MKYLIFEELRNFNVEVRSMTFFGSDLAVVWFDYHLSSHLFPCFIFVFSLKVLPMHRQGYEKASVSFPMDIDIL